MATKKDATTKKSTAKKSTTEEKASSKAAKAQKSKVEEPKKQAEEKKTAKKASTAKAQPAGKKAVTSASAEKAETPSAGRAAAPVASRTKRTTAPAASRTKAASSTKRAGASKTASAATTRRASKAEKAAAEAPAPDSRILEEDSIPAPPPTDIRQHFVEGHRTIVESAPQRDLPAEYGDTKIVLLVRDPEWVFAYWEVNDSTRAEFGLPRSGHNKRMVLRVYNVTGRSWPQENAQYFFDIDISPYANNWYIKVPETDAEWVAELGVFTEEGVYVPIVASNVVRTPRDTMSSETDEQWMVIEETFRKIYESSGGLRIRDGWRGSEELWRHLQKQIAPVLSGAPQFGGSGGVAGSGGLAAVAVERPDAAFWLRAETELILYGATEPTARVTVNDMPVKLAADGSFSLRFALPDGEQQLVVRAVSADGQHERSLTKVVRKLTK